MARFNITAIPFDRLTKPQLKDILRENDVLKVEEIENEIEYFYLDNEGRWRPVSRYVKKSVLNSMMFPLKTIKIPEEYWDDLFDTVKVMIPGQRPFTVNNVPDDVYQLLDLCKKHKGCRVLGFINKTGVFETVPDPAKSGRSASRGIEEDASEEEDEASEDLKNFIVDDEDESVEEPIRRPVLVKPSKKRRPEPEEPSSESEEEEEEDPEAPYVPNGEESGSESEEESAASMDVRDVIYRKPAVKRGHESEEESGSGSDEEESSQSRHKRRRY